MSFDLWLVVTRGITVGEVWWEIFDFCTDGFPSDSITVVEFEAALKGENDDFLSVLGKVLLSVEGNIAWEAFLDCFAASLPPADFLGREATPLRDWEETVSPDLLEKTET